MSWQLLRTSSSGNIIITVQHEGLFFCTPVCTHDTWLHALLGYMLSLSVHPFTAPA